MQEELIINKSQLLESFYNGSKSKENFRIGIEFEKLGVNSFDFKAVTYSGAKGILEFLKKYKHLEKWNYLAEDGYILGLKSNFGSITLEPGSQLEFSSSPQKTIHGIANQINRYNKITAEIAEEFDIYWLGYGIQPVSIYDDIELIPKKRYGIMNKYLPDKGNTPLVMMKESAGIQVTFDYESEEDAMNKLRVSLGISPIITAMFANSPIRNSSESGYKSFRAYSWLNTDNARCGLISKKIFDHSNYNFSFSDYVDILLDLPMIFLKKNNKWINTQHLTFREYIKNGYQDYKATIEDWNLHRSSFFPDVRLNNYLEIRNCDCQKSELILAVPALWKGIIYNNDALNSAWDLVKDLSWEEIQLLRNLVPKYGLDATVKNFKVLDIAKELVNIASCYLKSMPELNINTDFQDESVYLDSLKEILTKSRTSADKILELWHKTWNKDIKKLIEYTRI
ncbi:MAG: glutamate-cysteine ligase family protein [bacterium]